MSLGRRDNLADSADSARNVNDPLTVRLVCTKIPYQSIYGSQLLQMRNILENASTISIETNYRMMSYSRMYAGTASLVGNKLLNDELLVVQ